MRWLGDAAAPLTMSVTLTTTPPTGTPTTQRTRDMDLMSLPRETPIYIAGPMTGKPNFNYDAFVHAETTLRALGFTNIKNPVNADPGGVPGLRTWQWYMRKCIVMLMESEVIFMLNGWALSKGASTEYDLSMKLDMPAFFEMEEI